MASGDAPPSASPGPVRSQARPVDTAVLTREEMASLAQAYSRAIGTELQRLRVARGRSLRSLVLPGLLTRQTIDNNEKGIHSPSIYVLVLHILSLGAETETVLVNGIRSVPRGW